MTTEFPMDDRMGKYSDPYWRNPESAESDARTLIREWSWDEDAHGYCHQRNDLIALVNEIERLRAALFDALEENSRLALLTERTQQ